MKLLIVRHGDPDYTIDSLTEKGWREARYLAQKLSKLEIKDFYVSPLGRAKDTASCTLKKMNRTATECDWLKEFDVFINRPDVTDRKIIPWDWLPQDWTMDERFYQYDHWFENERIQDSDVKEYYDHVTGKFDEVLAKHGYVREGHYYRDGERKRRYSGIFLPFWSGMCAGQPPSQCFTYGIVAWSMCGTKFCDDLSYRREKTGDRQLPYEFFRRYFTSVCQR